MAANPEKESTLQADFLATRKYLDENLDSLKALASEDALEAFNRLPTEVKRLVVNLVPLGWDPAVQFVRSQSVTDDAGVESMRSLFDAFSPHVDQLTQRFRPDLSLLINEITALRPSFIYELRTQTPLLHLVFLDDDDKLLFENRESIPSVLETASSITEAVSRALQYCGASGASIREETRGNLKESVQRLAGRLMKVAQALGVTEQDLIEMMKKPLDRNGGGKGSSVAKD